MSGDIAIRLSTAQLSELAERASTGNYMLVRAEDSTWVQVHPWVSGENDD